MDSNILKTAISSVVFVAEVDIQKINAFDPKNEEARRPEYLFSLANIARNVSKAFMCVDHLITSYVAEAVGIDKDTLDKMVTATAEIIGNLSQAIRDNPEALLNNIGFIDKNGDQIGDRRVAQDDEDIGARGGKRQSHELSNSNRPLQRENEESVQMVRLYI